MLRLGIVVATILVLASAAKHTLTLGRERPSQFVVEVLETGKSSLGSPADVWVEDLVVDGRLLRFETLERTDGWELVSRFGATLPSSLHRTSGSAPARMSFRGSSFLMVLRVFHGSGGLIRVERDGRETQAIELPSEDEQLVLEDPTAPPSGTVFFAALVVFAGAAWWIGPLRRSRSTLPWLLFFLSVLHVLFWASQSIGVTNDSPVYWEGYDSFLAGTPSYVAPGYPVLVGLVDRFSGQNLGSVITLIQHAMVVAGGVWVSLLLRRLLSEEFALLGGLLAGALPPLLSAPQSVMSESPTLFAMVGALYFAVRSAETGRRRFAILAGLFTGWAGLLRVVPLAALLPAISLLHLFAAPKRWRSLGLTLLVAATVVLFPVSWFWFKSGQPRLVDSTPLHLFDRVVTEQRQLDEEAPATRRLLVMVGEDDPRDMAWWDVGLHDGMVLSDEEFSKLLWDVSIEGILKDPWAYLRFTPGLAWRELLADTSEDQYLWAVTVSPYPELESPLVLRLTASGLRWRWRMEDTFRILRYVLCWAAIVGTIVGMWLPRRTLVLALAWVPAGYLLATASLDYFTPRHNVAILPFVAALATVPLGLAFTAILHNRRTRVIETTA